MVIRHAEQRDKEGARQVRVSALPQDPFYSYEENIGVPHTINLVAEQNCKILGFVSVLLSRSNPQGQYLWQRLAPYVGFIGVRPEEQRKSIGNSLLRSAVKEATIRCPTEPFLYLECEAKSDLRLRFYEPIGFRAMPTEKVFNAVGMYPSAMLMWFDLHEARTRLR